jgi:hypothetical protein
MITLEIEFVSGEGGFSQTPLTYKQIIRNEKFAIYERSRDGKIKDFEVIKIRVLKKGTQIFQKVLEDDEEQYATTSIWGKFGWSFGSLIAAQSKYDELSNAQNAIEEVEGYDIEATEPKRGRVAKVRGEVSYPTTDKWTVKDILTINLDYDQPTISLFLKKQIEGNKVKLVGQVEKADGQRGKSANLYSLV